MIPSELDVAFASLLGLGFVWLLAGVAKSAIETPPVVVACAACKGTGKTERLTRVTGAAESGLSLKESKSLMMLLQGICLGCNGSGKVRL